MSKKTIKKFTSKYMNVSDDYLEEIAKHKYPCSNCGRKMFIHRLNNYAICDHCGYKVYKSKKDEFRDKLKQAMRKVN